MNPSARPQTSRNRDRALSRLNSITTGTAIAAAVATAGFGALAAFTYSGTTDAATTDTTTGASAAETTSPAAAAVTSPSTTGAAVSPLQPASAPVAAVKKKAKVTSGGSH